MPDTPTTIVRLRESQRVRINAELARREREGWPPSTRSMAAVLRDLVDEYLPAPAEEELAATG